MNGFRDSKEQTLNVASSGLELLKEVKVDAIIGPQKSAQANFLMDLGDKAKVPVISFSATSPSLRPRSPYFIQTGLSDDAQAGHWCHCSHSGIIQVCSKLHIFNSIANSFSSFATRDKLRARITFMA
nr:glutamate receptor 2.8-like [Ipomoea batatas]